MGSETPVSGGIKAEIVLMEVVAGVVVVVIFEDVFEEEGARESGKRGMNQAAPQTFNLVGLLLHLHLLLLQRHPALLQNRTSHRRRTQTRTQGRAQSKRGRVRRAEGLRRPQPQIEQR